jgi:hypothetical protein
LRVAEAGHERDTKTNNIIIRKPSFFTNIWILLCEAKVASMNGRTHQTKVLLASDCGSFSLSLEPDFHETFEDSTTPNPSGFGIEQTSMMRSLQVTGELKMKS